MVEAGPFRALSLDLWFTTVYHDGAFDARWEAARTELLVRRLRRPGSPVPPAEVRAALEAVRARLSAEGRDLVALDPVHLVQGTADALGAEPEGGVEATAEAFSSAGLLEFPPTLNPDALRLVRTLDARGVPAVMITNSARRASSWSSFLSAGDRPRFRLVVSSADVGVRKPDPRIFHEAARGLGVPASKLLHVGDRWELDVEGAIAAGCGAALYRGLWHRYPAGLYPPTETPTAVPPGVRVVDRLDELLEPSLWET